MLKAFVFIQGDNLNSGIAIRLNLIGQTIDDHRIHYTSAISNKLSYFLYLNVSGMPSFRETDWPANHTSPVSRSGRNVLRKRVQ